MDEDVSLLVVTAVTDSNLRFVNTSMDPRYEVARRDFRNNGTSQPVKTLATPVGFVIPFHFTYASLLYRCPYAFGPECLRQRSVQL